MDATVEIEEGFYVDPESKKTFFVKKTKNKKMTLIPPWVKTKPAEWKKIQVKKKK